MVVDQVIRVKGKGTVLTGILDFPVSVGQQVELHMAEGQRHTTRIMGMVMGADRLVESAPAGAQVAMIFWRIWDMPIGSGCEMKEIQ